MRSSRSPQQKRKKPGRPWLYPDGAVRLRVIVPPETGRILAEQGARTLRSSSSIARDLILQAIEAGFLRSVGGK